VFKTTVDPLGQRIARPDGFPGSIQAWSRQCGFLRRILAGRLARVFAILPILLFACQSAANGQSASAQMATPAAGAVLSGSTVSFSWAAGTSATGYWLYVGNTASGSSNLYNSGALSVSVTSVTVSGLPTNGVNLYVTLFSQIGGVWEPVNYVYTEAGTMALASMISPAQGSTLPGSTATFSWTAGSGPTGYWLYLGSTGVGSSNLYSSGSLSGTSVTVSSLPLNGTTIYVTLFSQIDGAWKPVNYTCTEALPPAPAAISAPTAGTVLSGSSVAFSWTAGSQVTAYMLTLGTTGAGSSNLYTSGSTTATSVTVSGLPTLSATVYATLSSEIAGAWQVASYTYTEAAPVLAALTSPSPGSVLSGSSVTFTWSAGSGPAAYWLYVGNTGAASSNLYNSGSISAKSVTVSGLPTSGVNLYVTLFSEIGGTWEPVNYTYTEAGTMALAALSSPSPGSILPGSAATFKWTAGSGPTGYWLELGNTGPGSSNLYSSGSISGTSVTVTGLPTSGATLYTTLFSEVNGGWKPVNYTYTESGAAGEATLSSVSCTSSSMTGAGTDSCTVTLNAATGSAGVDISLSSNNTAVSVPALVTVPASSSSVGFTATVSAVTTAQTVTLTASSDSASKTYSLKLNADVPTLSISSSTVPFGNVVLLTPTTQSLTLTSSGALPLTISGATLTGAGFSMSGVTFPVTLNPTKTATLELEFDPTVTGAATGQLTLASNSSTGATTVVNLTGTGQAPAYQVDLTWNAVTSTTVTIAGYYVFRATSPSTTYTMLTTGVDALTSFEDTSVSAGVTYDYYIESVDTAGVASAPSTIFSVTIP
jgi:hypothetical protein